MCVKKTFNVLEKPTLDVNAEIILGQTCAFKPNTYLATVHLLILSLPKLRPTANIILTNLFN